MPLIKKQEDYLWLILLQIPTLWNDKLYFFNFPTTLQTRQEIHCWPIPLTSSAPWSFQKVNSVERLSKHLDKDYHVTEACVLTDGAHPISIFSEIHSSKEKGFTSVNGITFRAMEHSAALFGKATFVMDRSYNDNKMFLKLDDTKQEYVFRLTLNASCFSMADGSCHTAEEPTPGQDKTVLCYKGKNMKLIFPM